MYEVNIWVRLSETKYPAQSSFYLAFMDELYKANDSFNIYVCIYIYL